MIQTPKTWKLTCLGDVIADMRGGASLKPDDFTDEGFPILHKGTIRSSGRLVFDRNRKSHTSSEYASRKPNSIVSSKHAVVTLRDLVPTGPTIGMIATIPDGSEYLLAQGAYGLELDTTKIHPRFLVHLSNARPYRSEIKKVMVGSTQVHVRGTEFQKLKIPLPTLSEQKRIADILDKADAIRRKRQQAIEFVRESVQASYDELFGQPLANPKGWPLKRLEEVVADGTSVSYGIVQCGEHVEDGVPYIRTSQMSDESLPALEEFDRTHPSIAAKYKRSTCRTGDLVFANRATIGAVVKLPEYLDGANLTQGTTRISPGKEVTSDYLLWTIRSNQIQFWFDRWAKGATFREITMGKLRETPIPVPPSDLQDEFDRRLQLIETTGGRLEYALRESTQLFNSLVQRAFKGEL